jgi:hypothetical protein
MIADFNQKQIEGGGQKNNQKISGLDEKTYRINLICLK